MEYLRDISEHVHDVTEYVRDGSEHLHDVTESWSTCMTAASTCRDMSATSAACSQFTLGSPLATMYASPMVSTCTHQSSVNANGGYLSLCMVLRYIHQLSD